MIVGGSDIEGAHKSTLRKLNPHKKFPISDEN
jgi:hypothetical protein